MRLLRVPWLLLAGTALALLGVAANAAGAGG
jgi:hypothetical protein